MLRREVEQRRLNVEVVLPAESQREAALLLAEGEAAPRREQGHAAAEAMRMLSEALATAGPQAREMFVLSQLDTLVAQVAEKAAGLQVREIHIIDNGDGKALPSVAASYPAIVTEVLRTLRDLTGVDIPSMLTTQNTQEGGR